MKENQSLPNPASPDSNLPETKAKQSYPWGMLVTIILGTLMVTGGVVHAAKLTNGDYLRQEINQQEEVNTRSGF